MAEHVMLLPHHCLPAGENGLNFLNCANSYAALCASKHRFRPTQQSRAMLTAAAMQVVVTAAVTKVLLMLAMKRGQPRPRLMLLQLLAYQPSMTQLLVCQRLESLSWLLHCPLSWSQVPLLTLVPVCSHPGTAQYIVKYKHVYHAQTGSFLGPFSFDMGCQVLFLQGEDYFCHGASAHDHTCRLTGCKACCMATNQAFCFLSA